MQERYRKSHIFTFVSTAPETTTFIFGLRSTFIADALVKCPVSFPEAAKWYAKLN